MTGIDATTQELLMDLLEAQAARGKTVVATTHDLACAAGRFQQVLAVNRTVVAYGPSNLVLDADVLAAAYGGHLLVIEGRTVVLDDAHHHDDAAPGERHFHEQGGRADGPAARAPLGDRRSSSARSSPLRSSASCARWWARTWSLRGIAFIGDAIAHAGFPGVVVAYMIGYPVLHRRGGGGRRNGARDRLRDQAGGPPPGHVDRRPVRGHVRPRRVPVQHDRRLRRGPVQLPVRQRAGHRQRRTWSRWWSSAAA